MSISEKANDLLNKFGRAQFDFVVWDTPDNAVARDKARQEISDYIVELEAAQRWAPLEDPPKFDGRYLLRNIYGDVYSSKYVVKTETWVVHDFAMFTHWMPLPQPPEVK